MCEFQAGQPHLCYKSIAIADGDGRFWWTPSNFHPINTMHEGSGGTGTHAQTLSPKPLCVLPSVSSQLPGLSSIMSFHSHKCPDTQSTPKSSHIPGSFWYQDLYVWFPHLFTLLFSSLSMMGPLLTFSFMSHVTLESWQLSRHGLHLAISISNLSHVGFMHRNHDTSWIFFWSDFLPGLEEAMKRRESATNLLAHIIKEEKEKQGAAGWKQHSSHRLGNWKPSV